MTMREQTAVFRTLAVLFDVAVLTALFVLLALLRRHAPGYWHLDLLPDRQVLVQYDPSRSYWQLIPILPLWIGALHLFDAFDGLRRVGRQTLFFRVTGAVLTAFFGLLVLLFSVQAANLSSRTVLFGFAFSSVPVLFLAHVAMGWWLRHSRVQQYQVQRVVVVGPPDAARKMRRNLLADPEQGFDVVGVVFPETPEQSMDDLQPLGTIHDLPEILLNQPIQQVFLSARLWREPQIRPIAELCENLGVRFSITANFLDIRHGKAIVQDLGGWSVLTFTQTPTSGVALGVKRLLDVLVSGLGLLLLSPMLSLVALLVKLQDGGPVLFIQERVGLYGRLFPMYKFRTMVVDAEKKRQEVAHLNEMDGPVFKITHDPRITRLGAFLRKTSLDEFPQLWNVLTGDMSLVGPRPPIMSEVRQYEHWQRRRLSMKPGITCIWQVSGRNEVDFQTWMKMDLEYIDNWSLLLDLKLFLMTLPVVLLRRGAA